MCAQRQANAGETDIEEDAKKKKNTKIMRSYAKLLNVLQTPINFVITYYGYYNVHSAYCFIPFLLIAQYRETIFKVLYQTTQCKSETYYDTVKRRNCWHPSLFASYITIMHLMIIENVQSLWRWNNNTQ